MNPGNIGEGFADQSLYGCHQRLPAHHILLISDNFKYALSVHRLNTPTMERGRRGQAQHEIWPSLQNGNHEQLLDTMILLIL